MSQDQKDSFEEFLSIHTRSIYIVGEINEQLVLNFHKALSFLKGLDSKKPVTVYINSPGGSYYDAIALYDLIKACSFKTSGIVLGCAMSAASIVLQAFKARLMGANGSLMIHDGAFSMEAIHSKEAVVAAKEEERNLYIMYSILASRSNLTLIDIKKMCEFSTYMNAEEALENGFIDKVLSPALLSRAMKVHHKDKQKNEL